MKVDLLNIDDFVELNHLKPITNPVLFQRGGTPHPDGLLSEDIFGVSPKTRKETFAYIDLKEHFFDPHVYKIVRAIFRNIDTIINGEETYSIKDGSLVKDPKGETGLEFVYKNWKKIVWAKSDKPGIRNQRVDLLNGLKVDEIFVTKWPVIPVFYRDIKTTQSGGATNDLNSLYSKLIRLSVLLENRDMFDFSFYQTNMNVQTTLVEIYDHFKSKLEKKTGMIRKYLMGKSVDYSTRTVITAPLFDAERPEDMVTGIEYSGVPIHQVCSLCYPFMIKWLRDFFEREVFDQKFSKTMITKGDNPEEYDSKLVKIDRPELVFTDQYFKKAIDSFIKNPGSRFDRIQIPLEDGTSVDMMFTGRVMTSEGGKYVEGMMVKRPMTWTDILYMAACDVVKDKHCMISRYPVLIVYSVFYTKIHVTSTLQTTVMAVGGTIYKNYPVVDLSLTHDQITSCFNDAVQFSNSFLEGINGDYDGDQTSIRVLWSQEANAECAKQINAKNFFLATDGKLIRSCSHEATQTIYVLTKDILKDAKTLSPSDVEFFTKIQPNDYSFSLVQKLFADRVEMGPEGTRKTKKIPSQYNYTDIINLPANLSPTGQALRTTLGRYVLYRALVSACGMEKIISFFTVPLAKGPFKAMEEEIAKAYRNDVITTDQIKKYIDTRDWIGYQWHPIFCTSFSPEIIKIHPTVKKLKEDLLKKHEKDLAAGDARVSEMIENALVEKTKEVFKGNLGMDLYDSGARGSLSNNYKNNYLYRGAVANPMTGKFDIITNSLSDGLAKRDIPATSNGILGGAYPKAVGTAESGYLAKQLIAALQTEILDEPGTDCGSKNTLDIVITKDMSVDDRYIVEGGKLIRLTTDIRPKYTGKRVKMRSPMCCLGTKICNICAGDQYYKQQVRNIGLLSTELSGALTNGNMQKFHSNLVVTKKINPDEMIL